MPSPDILIVEDGSIVEDANSYITYDYAENYHTLRGNSAWADGDTLAKQQAIIRATQSIDALYKAYWLEDKLSDAQELEFPRGEENEEGVIPKNLKKAVAEAALRELEAPNGLAPDLDRGGKIKKVKADVVEVEYMDGASAMTVYTMLDGLLADLISSTPGATISSHDLHLA